MRNISNDLTDVIFYEKCSFLNRGSYISAHVLLN